LAVEQTLGNRVGEQKSSVAYFNKNVHPEAWGMRDGRWKWISELQNPQKNELYDLLRDPEEKENLAARYPERVEKFRRRTADWYVATNAEFVKRLEKFELLSAPNMQLTPEQLTLPGPKLIQFGIFGEEGSFQVRKTFSLQDNPVAWVQWVAYGEPHRVVIEWVAPSGRIVHSEPFRLESDWTRTRLSFKGDASGKDRVLTPGRWMMRVRDEGRTTNSILLEGSFLVN
jgi:hypothetical protein